MRYLGGRSREAQDCGAARRAAGGGVPLGCRCPQNLGRLSRRPGRRSAEERVSSMTRVALVHDWLTGMRGGEKVLEEIAAPFPGAPIFTLFHFPGSVSSTLESH